MNRLLLVEDDFQISEIIEDYFSSKCDEFDITCVFDGSAGLEYIKNNNYDLVMLDVMLPHVDGFTLCREIRKTSDVPILFLTARTREDDILHGYELGCDDYIGKPFSLVRLHAKVKALLNRSKGTILNDVITCGQIKINKRTLEVFVNDESLYLPPKEFALLNYLIEHKNWVISRETLITHLWNDDDIIDRVVDNHIKKLRKALGPAGNQIKTIISKGYKITD